LKGSGFVITSNRPRGKFGSLEWRCFRSMYIIREEGFEQEDWNYDDIADISILVREEN